MMFITKARCFKSIALSGLLLVAAAACSSYSDSKASLASAETSERVAKYSPEKSYPVNYIKYSDNFSSAGMPDEHFISVLKQQETELVVNVAPPAAHGALEREEELVTSAGMRYINIPVDWNRPTRQDVGQFLNLMQKNEGTRVFLHCQKNLRASAFAFLHRVINLGESPQAAADDLLSVWTPDATWTSLINTALAEHNIDFSITSKADH